MLIGGAWLLCDDGIVRPVIRGEILTGAGHWLEVPFQVDTGADHTAFSAEVLAALDLKPQESPLQFEGVGGIAPSVVVETQVRLPHETGNAVFRGQFAALTLSEALDMCVLGRDITNLFATIVDRPGDVVCLAGQQHGYVIVRK
jgi:hypothetical protein